MSRPTTLHVSLPDLSKMIDHSLLHPTLTDTEVAQGLETAKKYNVATACVKPYHIPFARKRLEGTSVLVCPVIGFPHGNSTSEVKVFEAIRAVEEGGNEVDMVVNVGRVLSGKWEYVVHEIRLVNEAVTGRGAVLKVIFENDYLGEKEIVKLCEICSELGVAFVKTSTGYGFVKQASGEYNYKGATIPHLELMRKHASPNVQIKAAGGVRTLDDLLRVRALGVSRVGATATEAILEEAMRRGIGNERVQVEVKW
ncbi:deoxyribose-phosphate aldolase [Mollisia scopiformis]|uniref:deoxyribose-phosphate aldolase n=1 Tax=Mollisia scopiformis TaxID=149040 RepID=A0A194XBF8_MOLSC|nr:deoxyribose-phosphate aldolase [Mollisia scopiformis]KUJ17500.1 deoxyribose-phosphate aldolase [Mollisia scopiformis]